MATLLKELRRLGYAVHFAGVRMTVEEKTSTLPMVDKWVWDFESPRLLSGFSKIRSSLKYRIRRILDRLWSRKDRLDDWFCDHWLGEALHLQQQGRYSRVLVAYVYHSKFLLAFPNPCLRIIDTHDAFSYPRNQPEAGSTDGPSRSYSVEEEKRGLLRAQRVIAIQDWEAAYFRQLLGSAGKVYTVGHIAEPLSVPLISAPAARVGCIGTNWWVNLQGYEWFLREAWPQIRERVPAAEIWVAGGMSGQCTPASGVRLLGQVPSLLNFYQECPVFINTAQRGTGLKIKTIEALMHGRPVVTTGIGAEGLEQFRGQGLFVCDTAEEFAGAVVNLLSNLPLAQQIGEAALRCAQNYVAENRKVLAAALMEKSETQSAAAPRRKNGFVTQPPN